MAFEVKSSFTPEPVRTADITMRLSEFEIPPMQDVLLVGKKASIGPEAVRRMVDSLSPDKYDIIRVDHPIFEAIVIKTSLLKLVSQDKLLPVILEEGSLIAGEESVVRAQISIVVQVNRGIEI